MVQPVDYGAVIASGRALVPDYAAQLMRERLMGVQEREADAQYVNAQTNAAQEERLLSGQTRQVRRQDAFAASVQEWVRNPSMQGMDNLFGAFPEFVEPARRAAEMRESETQDRTRQNLTELYSVTRNAVRATDEETRRRNLEIALGIVRARRAADFAAGGDTSDEDELISIYESGDPERIREAHGLITLELAGAMGPSHFASALDRLGDEEAERYAETLGHARGSDEWRDAVRDYVLRGSGPTAHGYNVAEEEVRQQNRVEIEGVQHNYRTTEEGQRQEGRESLERVQENNRRTRPAPPPAQGQNVLGRIQEKLARGETLTPGEQRVYDDSLRGRSRGRGRAPAPANGQGNRPRLTEGQIVRDTRTGRRFRVQGGRLVPVQ
jgi:hypothetical protein